jgi:Protein of unknown function (DUF1615)
MWLGWLFSACVAPPEPDPGLSLAAIADKIAADAEDREGWAADVRQALVLAGRVPDESHVCQVLAILEQESGYEADPAVPGLPAIARTAIEERLSLFGPATDLGVDWLLSPTPEGQTQSFRQRLDALRTERDLDVLFRELVAHHTAKVPKALTAATEALAGEQLARLNPVQTAGSMQVSVIWAQDLGRERGLSREEVRDTLYTRAGGLTYGTARLFAHDAPYDDPKYRFADYNAGLYASRNASFQVQLAALTGLTVAPDGDLLQYNDGGRPRAEQEGQTMAALRAWRTQFAAELTDGDLIRDAREEKQATFEETDLWSRVRATFQAKLGKTPTYARVPDVSLESPKMTKPRTTSWFASSVARRYQDCLQR